MTTTKQASALVAGHFNQGDQYYSASKGAMIPIAEMVPAHAANAAEALLRQAAHWADQAGITRHPFSWVTYSPLVRALQARAAVIAQKPEDTPDHGTYSCHGCSFTTTVKDKVFGHSYVTGHGWAWSA